MASWGDSDFSDKLFFLMKREWLSVITWNLDIRKFHQWMFIDIEIYSIISCPVEIIEAKVVS